MELVGVREQIPIDKLSLAALYDAVPDDEAEDADYEPTEEELIEEERRLAEFAARLGGLARKKAGK